MATFEELQQERFKKLERMQKAGILAYPAQAKKTHSIAQVLERFDDLAKAETEICIVGRIRAIRGHGGSTFLNIEDESGSMQAYLKKDRVGEQQYDFFLETFDIGDFVQLRGVLFTTKRGEKTLEIADHKILAKSLRPLPDKWHGLQDEEERFRRRYLDLIFNKDVKEKFEKRAKIISGVRGFLDNEGFVEVETPVLQSMYGGADAQPFITHINAFDLDMYLRISLELPLKRLIVGGFEKVYEMGRVFRNEGVDRQHNPDFTMLEFYWAYADYKDLMKLTERMFENLLTQVLGTMKLEYEGKEIDFTPPWPRVEYGELFRKYADIDIQAMNRDALFAKAKKLGAKVDETFSKARVEDAIYKKAIRPNLWEPQFVIHHPAEMFPLAKTREENPAQAETFQLLVAGGWEIVKAYSEQNDPILQRKAFEEQESLFRKGLEDAQRMDLDFVEALEYGMPPTAGFGMGIDRLTALLTNSHSLREVILFPTMKPR
ncbi:MAG: lysine--tRNA ligase [Candidatus Wildermuthbacteria bacterium RIFCSPHIGHO2_12_FULL_45_9]|uniref:Lysine--tRNA ligase n=1 Tax=Candidatus Wildermuthbacteria bacterium RIFCSPHIGHO2_02_FULL_45_25 TaxID=1802450 RepID=A0A1G2R5R0_9BACT|nr:MAG: lysine--tRNA ligase [Candidatus Wildermuthbacteria bacterium RIFCSPHIGHO2_01_FULL_45_20]OHA67729.1 MAG: lysine--tRNA ligase [Candidatus Wildermuthbacteria bacterium RIFCSPHIGHO2_02_FULL_45_25]OHA71861.1 MAG: lysine--tRNA ligase [Candidatus Wildermuthbacteria bacterium RIFCSPHIGHO2_12_FULL_45_9]